MAEAWVGTYKLVSSDKFDDFLGAAGVNAVMRKLANEVKPDLKMEVAGDNWTMTNISPVKTVVVKFKLDEEFDHETPDGRKVKATVTMEKPTRMVMNQKEPKTGKESIITRELNGSKMTCEFKCGSVVATRVYETK